MGGNVLKITIVLDITKLSPNIQHVSAHFWKLILTIHFWNTKWLQDKVKDFKQLGTSTWKVYFRLLESAFPSGTWHSSFKSLSKATVINLK